MKHDLALVAPKLEKLILLLGSDRDGEVLAAASGIRRVLAAQGFDLHDLVAALEPQAQATCCSWRAEPGDLPNPAEMLEWLLYDPHGCRLAERELLFLENLRCDPRYWRGGGLVVSPKQEKWLRDIYCRARSGGAR